MDFCRSYINFVVRPIFLMISCILQLHILRSAVGLGYVYYRMIYLLRYLIIFWIRRQKIMRINLYFSYRAAAVHEFT